MIGISYDDIFDIFFFDITIIRYFHHSIFFFSIFFFGYFFFGLFRVRHFFSAFFTFDVFFFDIFFSTFLVSTFFLSVFSIHTIFSFRKATGTDTTNAKTAQVCRLCINGVVFVLRMNAKYLSRNLTYK